MSNFGRRGVCYKNTQESTAQTKPTSVSERVIDSTLFGDRPVRICRSHLVVTEGFYLGSDLKKVVKSSGLDVETITNEWGSGILNRLQEQRYDIAIYNTTHTEEYLNSLNSQQKPLFQIAGSIGPSMGGRNFSIIGRSGHPLTNQSVEKVLQNIQYYPIYVGVNTDRYRSLLRFLKMKKDSCDLSKLQIIDIVDPQISCLKYTPDALLVCGQNVRCAALLNDDFKEIVSYSALTRSMRCELREWADNSLLISNRLRESLMIKPEDFIRLLKANMLRLKPDSPEWTSYIESIKDQCFDSSAEDSLDLSAMIEGILFETYRIGRPQW